MYQALLLKQPEGIHIPGERTVYRVMEETGLSHRPKRRPNGITKAGREARKSDDLLKRDFTSEEPLKKMHNGHNRNQSKGRETLRVRHI